LTIPTSDVEKETDFDSHRKLETLIFLKSISEKYTSSDFNYNGKLSPKSDEDEIEIPEELREVVKKHLYKMYPLWNKNIVVSNFLFAPLFIVNGFCNLGLEMETF
jgi:hypothetical protein